MSPDERFWIYLRPIYFVTRRFLFDDASQQSENTSFNRGRMRGVLGRALVVQGEGLLREEGDRFIL